MGSPTPSEDQPAIRFNGVSFSYGRVPAVDGVSFCIPRGEVAYLVGPSAAGKTTLLKLAHGQLRAQRGGLLVDGCDLVRARGRTLRRMRRRVGVVFQDYRLLRRLTAVENVAYALRVADLWLPRREALGRARIALEAVGMAGRAGAFPHQLSGGQQQRLAIARALAARPAILLADEPTASLDRVDARKILSLFDQAAGEGATVLVATHDEELVGASRRRVIGLSEGRVASDHVLSRSA
jgi:cell division transport system ATP-binding protein